METSTGTGSGVMVQRQGATVFIVTNHHVIEGGGRIGIRYSLGGRGDAILLGYDAYRDLAVLSVSCAGCRTVPLSETLSAPGTDVFAMGYPLGVDDATVTRGVVSANWDEDLDEGQRWLVQTDAPINPGNSGGPLFNRHGEVVGINTSKIEETPSGRSVEGFGFAVASRTVIESLPDLIAGVRIEDTSAPLVFPDYQEIAANLTTLRGSTRWRRGESVGGTTYYYGHFSGGYFGMLPANPVKEIFVFVENRTSTRVHTRVIEEMLIAVGLSESDAQSVVARHGVRPREFTECMAPGQVLLSSNPRRSGTTDWYTSIDSSTSSGWWDAPPC